MSDYIEDRIKRLEDQTQAIVDELKVLNQFTTDIVEKHVNALEDWKKVVNREFTDVVEAQTKINDRSADGANKIKDLQFSVEKLFRLDNTTNYSLREIWKEIAKIQDKQNKVGCAKDHTDQSTEEFVRVKHGHWIDHEPFDKGNDNCNKCIECSVCKTWFGHDCYAKTNYCPNCGAKMDEVAE